MNLEKKISMAEVRERRIKGLVDSIAQEDVRIADHFRKSKGLSEKLQTLPDGMSGDIWGRNSVLGGIINFESGAEKLFLERRKLVEGLRRELAGYNAKGMKELKEQLGIVNPGKKIEKKSEQGGARTEDVSIGEDLTGANQ